MKKIVLTVVLILVISVMQGGVLLAAEQPEIPFDSSVVDRIDMREHVIVLNDTSAKIADYVVVRNAKGSIVPASAVKAGDVVVVATSQKNGDARPVVTEIKIISSK